MTDSQKVEPIRPRRQLRHRPRRRPPKTLVSHLAPRVVADPMLTGIRLPGTVKARARRLRRP